MESHKIPWFQSTDQLCIMYGIWLTMESVESNTSLTWNVGVMFGWFPAHLSTIIPGVRGEQWGRCNLPRIYENEESDGILCYLYANDHQW